MASISSLKNSKEWSDLIISCDGRDWHVHKAIVCSASPVFARMCKSEFKEATENHIELSEENPEAVDRMLDVLYGSVSETESAKAHKCGESYHYNELEKHPYLLVSIAEDYMLAEKYDILPAKHASRDIWDAMTESFVSSGWYGPPEHFVAAVQFIWDNTADNDVKSLCVPGLDAPPSSIYDWQNLGSTQLTMEEKDSECEKFNEDVQGSKLRRSILAMVATTIQHMHGLIESADFKELVMENAEFARDLNDLNIRIARKTHHEHRKRLDEVDPSNKRFALCQRCATLHTLSSNELWLRDVKFQFCCGANWQFSKRPLRVKEATPAWPSSVGT